MYDVKKDGVLKLYVCKNCDNKELKFIESNTTEQLFKCENCILISSFQKGETK